MPVILVWLDDEHDEAGVREALGAPDVDLIVARWDPDAEDDGRTELLTSIRSARDRIAADGGDPEKLTLVGLGLGAVAAAGVTRYAKRLGIGLGRVIAVAGRWDEPDPFSGSPHEEVPERVELVPDYLLATTLRRT